MTRTSNIYARVEPELKQQAEIVLDRLGIPMSNAISIFLKQVVLQRGLPFEVKIPVSEPISSSALTKAQFDAEIEKGFADMREGRVTDAKNALDRIKREMNL